eukprot:6071775-Amphidinium_carterae.2
MASGKLRPMIMRGSAVAGATVLGVAYVQRMGMQESRDHRTAWSQGLFTRLPCKVHVQAPEHQKDALVPSMRNCCNSQTNTLVMHQLDHG